MYILTRFCNQKDKKSDINHFDWFGISSVNYVKNLLVAIMFFTETLTIQAMQLLCSLFDFLTTFNKSLQNR